MNKREKKLMLVTVLVVLVGLIAFLSGGDETANADAAPAQASSESASPPAATTTKSSASSAADSSATSGLSAFRFRVADLQQFLQQRRQPVLLEAREDPFRELEPVVLQSTTAAAELDIPEPPVIGGVFLSGRGRGALLDGKVCFEGDTSGDYELVEVTKTGVRLRYQERFVDVEYDPTRTQRRSQED